MATATPSTSDGPSRSWKSAGVAALSIEDTVLPRSFGQREPLCLVPIEEGVSKMRAAVDARQDPRLVIAGRTSIVPSAGADNTVARAKAYAAAGIDAFFVVGVQSRDVLARIRDAIDLPIILGGASGDLMDLDYLSRLGVRICLQGHQPFMASVQAVHDTLKALRGQVPPAKLDGIASTDLINRLTRNASYQDWIRDFLQPGRPAAQSVYRGSDVGQKPQDHVGRGRPRNDADRQNQEQKDRKIKPP